MGVTVTGTLHHKTKNRPCCGYPIYAGLSDDSAQGHAASDERTRQHGTPGEHKERKLRRRRCGIAQCELVPHALKTALSAAARGRLVGAIAASVAIPSGGDAASDLAILFGEGGCSGQW